MKLATAMTIMTFITSYPGVKAMTTKTLQDPSNIGTVLFPLDGNPDKFILQDEHTGSLIITHDPGQGLTLVSKVSENYKTINSLEGIIDMKDLSITNHNINLLAKQLVTPTDTLYKTVFDHKRIGRAQQSKNLVILPKFNGLKSIETRNNKANMTLSYPNCERFCFAQQSHIPSTMGK